MSFTLPDLVIESVIRDGLEQVKQDNTILDDVFGNLLAVYNTRKYGTNEIQRIKDYINNHNIAVVHSFHLVASKMPCISIQLGAESEAQDYARIGDGDDIFMEALSAQELMDNEFVNDTFTYDPATGKVTFTNPIDATKLHIGNRFVQDPVDVPVLGILADGVIIEKGLTLTADPAIVRSFIQERMIETSNIYDNVNLLVGIHTEEPLLTKYLYVLVKYFLKSRKQSLSARCLSETKVSGSDFTRDLGYKADNIFTRYITVMGKSSDTWRADQVDQFDCVELDVTIGE